MESHDGQTWTVVHVTADAGAHRYFDALLEHRDPQYQICIGSVEPAGKLQERMLQLGAATFALGAQGRSDYPLAIGRLAVLIAKTRPAIVQTHLVEGGLVGLLAARLVGAPAIFTAHHSSELPFHGRKLVWSDRLCAGPLSDRVIAPSQQTAETLSRLAGTQISKISVIPHGFSLTRFNPDSARPDRVRSEFGLEDATVFGAIGRLTPLKNHEALVRAFVRVQTEVPDSFLLIVGYGDQDPLRRLAFELGVGHRVLLSGPRDDIPDVLAALDVFVHPSLAETFGQVIVEAMAMGRPVVSTPVGAAPELIETGTTGVLATSPAENDLTSAMQRIVSMRERWPELGAAARSRISGFTQEAMVDGYEAVYASLVKARRTGRSSRIWSRVR